VPIKKILSTEDKACRRFKGDRIMKKESRLAGWLVLSGVVESRRELAHFMNVGSPAVEGGLTPLKISVWGMGRVCQKAREDDKKG